MANFSTEFPISNKKSVEDVVRLACNWISGSPHTNFDVAALSELPIDAERTVELETEQVILAITHQPDFDIGGLRYIRTEEGLEWTTSIVALKTSDRHLLSIQVICEALNTAVRLPPPRKPVFIRQALTELGGGEDGDIPLTDKPFRLTSEEPSIAAALMLGTAKNTLPIVYVSSGFSGGHSVSPDELAKLVSGMAHVIVEPNRNFSIELRKLTNSRNVFGGAVGVYWPESEARKTYFLDQENPNSRALQLAVAKDIRVALSNRRQRTHCTWAHLKENVARKRYDFLKAEGATGVQQYIDAFDADLSARDIRLREMEDEIARLNSELRRMAIATQSNSHGLLLPGKEQDLYQREIEDIVIDSLNDALRATPDATRRHHVINDLLKANVKSGEGHRLSEEIKALLKTYQEMDARTRSALVRLGFDVSEDGKHYKAVFQGDGRYTFALAKSSSDHRAGKNAASDINKTLF